MSNAVLQVDIHSYSKEQHDELHTAAKEGGIIYSHSFHDFKPTTWRAHAPILMKATKGEEVDGDVTVTYTCPPSFHELFYTYRVHKIPSIRVKDPDLHRICWPYNLGVNLCTDAKLTNGGFQMPSLDSVVNDIHHQYNIPPGKENQIDKDLGNVPEMINFSEILPEYDIIVYDPWFYAQDTSLAIPLYLSDDQKIIHEYKYRSRISKLLRMQEKVVVGGEETWVTIPCNLKNVEIYGGKEELKMPELYGRFGLFDKDELDTYLNFWKDENDKSVPNAEKIYWINDYIRSGSLNPVSIGSNVTVEFESRRPVKALYWVVENVEATELNNFSNYTTDRDCIKAGRSPWTSYEYTYSTSVRLPANSSIHALRAEPRMHAESIPRVNGYGMYSYSWNPMSIEAEVGIVFTGKESMRPKLTFTLKDDDPYARFNDEEKKTGSKLFKVHVRLLVTRRLSYKHITGSSPPKFEIELR